MSTYKSALNNVVVGIGMDLRGSPLMFLNMQSNVFNKSSSDLISHRDVTDSDSIQHVTNETSLPTNIRQVANRTSLIHQVGLIW